MTTEKIQYPQGWLVSSEWNPNDHLMKLQGKDYLNVQNRIVWFVKMQRELIDAGLATTTYVIENELIDHDKENQSAYFKTYIRDVLGNESTAYGSESIKDFKDFYEKSGTKSCGRALAFLGYGTAFSPEMDEGDRVVDAPVDRQKTYSQKPVQSLQNSIQPSSEKMSIKSQHDFIQRLQKEKNKMVTPIEELEKLSFMDANVIIKNLQNEGK